MEASTKGTEVFYSYACEDEEFGQELEKHLGILQKEGMIAHWHNRQILAGTDYSQAIDPHVTAASLILFLISSDFMASGYCSSIEMKQALERHRVGEARVIPIIVRQASWQWAPFSTLQVLPRDGKPLKLYTDRDEAFGNVVKDIRRVIEWL